MRQWSLVIDLENPSGPGALPRFLQIARAITLEVRRGRLSPGDALPGSRVLAEMLGVHRNTVLAAYRELLAEGWISVEAARGTFVSSELPEVSPRRFSSSAGLRAEVPSRIGFELGPPPAVEMPAAVVPGVLSLSGGIPDVRLVPRAKLARAVRRALRKSGVLGYGDPRGSLALRSALGKMLSRARALAAASDSVMATRGSQMAIDLVARSLLSPGDVVAVEVLGYRPAWEALRAAGAKLVPIPTDASGLDVDALERLSSVERVRMLYVTPHHQYPTTVTLAPGRRIKLLELARRAHFPILEDDYDHEFHYDGRPVLPLASADRAGVVVYVGTLSKVLAPGLRIGYLVAPPVLLERIAARRRITDRQGDQVVEEAVAELLEEGEIQRHVRRARRIYADRRALLASLLEKTFAGLVSFDLPAGGTALWARVAPGVDVEEWSARALARGVAIQPARVFAFDGRSRPYFRLGFAQLDERELREAVRRMDAARPGS